jgi:hypothetical protein
LYLIQCWKAYREPTVNSNKLDALDSLFSSDDDQDATASVGNSTSQIRTPKKSINITKASSPLPQARQRHPPNSTRQTPKRGNNSFKTAPNYVPYVDEDEPSLDDSNVTIDSKEVAPSITSNNTSNETITESPTEDQSIKTNLVENLAATDSSAFSHVEETNAVPEANTVDLAEADDDFITAGKRKRRRTRGGAKLQRQKMTQLEQSSSGPDLALSKKPVRTSSDEQASTSVQKSSPREGGEKSNHRYSHHTPLVAHEQIRAAKHSFRQSSNNNDDPVHEDTQATPKSSPRTSNSNITYADVAASTSSSSPIAEQRTTNVISSPPLPVSPALSQSSVVSNNEKRQSWYSPFSSGLELDIVPRPQPSLSSESVLFRGKPSPIAMERDTGNYQHPDVLNALFRGGESFLPVKGNALGLVQKYDNSEMRYNQPENHLVSTPYQRWDLFNNTRTPIAPPSSGLERPLNMVNVKTKPDWDTLLSTDEFEARNPRHSWGAIGNFETERMSTQPEPIQHERKKSNSGFSFFDRRLSTFSPRR